MIINGISGGKGAFFKRVDVTSEPELSYICPFKSQPSPKTLDYLFHLTNPWRTELSPQRNKRQKVPNEIAKVPQGWLEHYGPTKKLPDIYTYVGAYLLSNIYAGTNTQ